MADSQSVVVSPYEEYTLTRKMWGESPWGSWCGPDILRVGRQAGAGRQEQGGTGKQEQGEAGRGWGPCANLGSGCRKAPVGMER